MDDGYDGDDGDSMSWDDAALPDELIRMRNAANMLLRSNIATMAGVENYFDHMTLNVLLVGTSTSWRSDTDAAGDAVLMWHLGGHGQFTSVELVVKADDIDNEMRLDAWEYDSNVW
jgi:hypothetical protein